MLGLSISWVILMLRQVPCMQGGNSFDNSCYSDIPVLYHWRGMRDGLIPIIEAELEYPVGSALLMEAARRLIPLFASYDDASAAAAAYFGINAVILFALMGVTVWAMTRMARPGDALLVALSPAVMTTGLINWDAGAVVLSVLALLAWSRKKPILTGVLLGLGVAVKLYPLFFLGPLAVLCLRTGRMRAFLATFGTGVLTWVAINLPYYLANPQNWFYFWTFNYDERGPDLGSFWLVLSQLGQEPTNLSRAEIVLMLLGCIVIALLLLFASKRPRLVQGCFLVLTWFLIINKVYSPQYVLWLLPLLVLANPRKLSWVIFSIAETGYFFAVWAYLAAARDGGEYRFYWVAIAVRVLVQLWLCAQVVADIIIPERDPMGQALREIDEGLFSDMSDVGWLAKVREKSVRMLSSSREN